MALPLNLGKVLKLFNVLSMMMGWLILILGCSVSKLSPEPLCSCDAVLHAD